MQHGLVVQVSMQPFKKLMTQQPQDTVREWSSRKILFGSDVIITHPGIFSLATTLVTASTTTVAMAIPVTRY